MPLASVLLGSGIPDLAARRLGQSALQSVTAAGTTTSDATVLKKAQNLVALTASGSDGARLPADAENGDFYIIYAVSGNGKVYPPSGHAFNGDTADQSQAIAQNLCALFMKTGSTSWISICGAVVPA